MLILAVCAEIDDYMNKPAKPDFALDFTRQGIPSEAVKVIVKSMKIPTIAGTFGQEGDVRYDTVQTSVCFDSKVIAIPEL